MAIFFFANHRSEERRQMMIDRIAALCAQGLLVKGAEEGGPRMAEQPTDQYRRYARKLLELVEAA